MDLSTGANTCCLLPYQASQQVTESKAEYPALIWHIEMDHNTRPIIFSKRLHFVSSKIDVHRNNLLPVYTPDVLRKWLTVMHGSDESAHLINPPPNLPRGGNPHTSTGKPRNHGKSLITWSFHLALMEQSLFFLFLIFRFAFFKVVLAKRRKPTIQFNWMFSGYEEKCLNQTCLKIGKLALHSHSVPYKL